MKNNLLTNAPLFYPSAREWMWDYCVYLGPYTVDGKNYDLGIFLKKDGEASAAIVYGDTPGNYISGDLSIFGKDEVYPNDPAYKYYSEVKRRATELGIYNEK